MYLPEVRLDAEILKIYSKSVGRCVSRYTDPVFLSSEGDFGQKVLFHKRSHGIVNDDDLWSVLCHSLDAVIYGPVAGGAPRHHSHLPVSKTLDDAAHLVQVFFCNHNHDVLDP